MQGGIGQNLHERVCIIGGLEFNLEAVGARSLLNNTGGYLGYLKLKC